MKRIMVVAMILSVFALYGAAPLILPQPLPVSTPVDQFSAGRAMQHVSVISQETHPAGSPAMADVVAYLLGRLRSYGLQPQVMETYAMWEGNPIRLSNVVARIQGTASHEAVLFLAHPDSDPSSPGSGDNGSGVAVLLEVARALTAGPAQQNDIIVLFDDGEEIGYLGAYAFIREHPWVRDVRLAIGLDTAAWGPVVLLQTAPDNGKLVQGYRQAVASPVAFGFFADADMKLAQDDSEILPFMEYGLPGLALEDPVAFVGKHSGADIVERVNPGSLQQMGDQVLALARQYAGMDLSQVESADASYFTFWGLGLVHYPAGINAALGVFLSLSFIALAVVGLIRKAFTRQGLGFGALVSLGFVGLAVFIGVIAAVLFRVWFPNPNPNNGSYLTPAGPPFLGATIIILVSIYLAAYRWLRLKFGPANLAVSGLVPWMGLSLVTAWILPIGSYLFLWPFLLAVAAWVAIVSSGSNFISAHSRVFLALPAAMATALVTPNLVLCYLGAGVEITPLIAALVMLVLYLWLPVSAGQREHSS